MEKKVWIVVNSKGEAYDGVFGKRRVDAKLAHVKASYGVNGESPDGKSLTDKQEEAWAKCVETGDKVVKATLSWSA